MAHITKQKPPQEPHHADETGHGDHANGAAGTIAGHLAYWFERLRSKMEHAERRITENFRVPPGGG